MTSSTPISPTTSPGTMLSLRALRIVFVVLFISVFAYAFIGTFVGDSLPRYTEDLQQLYRLVSFLGGICVAALLLIRNLVSRVFVRADTETAAADPRAAARRLFRVRLLTLVALVISELIAVLGLLFILMGGHRRTLYIFCAISIACLILFFPRDSN